MKYHNGIPLRIQVLSPQESKHKDMIGITGSPYVKQLEAALEQRERDKEAAEHGRITATNVFVAEFLWTVQTAGEITEARLGRESYLSVKAVAAIGKFLVEMGRVWKKKTRRNAWAYLPR